VTEHGTLHAGDVFQVLTIQSAPRGRQSSTLLEAPHLLGDGLESPCHPINMREHDKLGIVELRLGQDGLDPWDPPTKDDDLAIERRIGIADILRLTEAEISLMDDIWQELQRKVQGLHETHVFSILEIERVEGPDGCAETVAFERSFPGVDRIDVGNEALINLSYDFGEQIAGHAQLHHHAVDLGGIPDHAGTGVGLAIGTLGGVLLVMVESILLGIIDPAEVDRDIIVGDDAGVAGTDDLDLWIEHAKDGTCNDFVSVKLTGVSDNALHDIPRLG